MFDPKIDLHKIRGSPCWGGMSQPGFTSTLVQSKSGTLPRLVPTTPKALQDNVTLFNCPLFEARYRMGVLNDSLIITCASLREHLATL